MPGVSLSRALTPSSRRPAVFTRGSPSCNSRISERLLHYAPKRGKRLLEPAFLDDDGVTRPHAGQRGHRSAHHAASGGPIQMDIPAIGARREATSNRDRGLYRHVRHVRILARSRHLTEYEKGPVDLDFDRDVRLTDETTAQAIRDEVRQFFSGVSARLNHADQWDADFALRVDNIGVGKAFLPKHDDAEPVTGIERIRDYYLFNDSRYGNRACGHRRGDDCNGRSTPALKQTSKSCERGRLHCARSSSMHDALRLGRANHCNRLLR